MITLLRKFRQKLLSENKFSKYLLYAIGEIVLVVIGILIALWINNTYEDYKNKQLSIIYLEDFKRDLVVDSTLLAERIKLNKTIIQSIDSIEFMLNTKAKFTNNDLKRFFNHNLSIMYESYFIPEKSTIRQFEASGNTNIISSKTIKDKLFEYHAANDRNDKNMETSIQLYQHNFITRDFVNMVMTKEVIDQYNGIESSMNQESINTIKANKNYQSSLYLKRGVTENQIVKYNELKTKVIKLLELIETELK